MLKKIKQLLFLDPKYNYTRYRDQFEETQLQLKSGLIINYATAGSGQTLVFLHGLANNWMMWIPLAMRLKDKYRVVLLDLPGYGKSSKLDEYSLKSIAVIIADFIKEAGLKPLSIIGLSLGSQIAATFIKHYPQMASSAVLNGPIFKIHDIGHLSDYFTDRIHDASNIKLLMPVLRKYIKNTALSYATSKYLNYYKFNRFLLDNYTREGRRQVDALAWLQLSADAADIKLENILSKVKMPVLLVFGDHDKWSSLEGARKLLPDKANIRFVKIKNAGHSVSTEQAAPVAQAVKKFLAEI